MMERMGGKAKPAAVVLSPESPYPAIGGGPIRTASLIEYLAGRYDLDLITFRQPGAPDPRVGFPKGHFRSVHVIDLPYHARGLAARAARNLRRVWRGVAPLNDRFSGFEAEIAGIVGGERYQLAVVEHFWCAEYQEQLAERAESVVLDLHNIESEFYERSASVAESWPAAAMLRRFAGCARRLEEQWLPRFNRVLATSNRDARLVQGVAPESTPLVYPNALPLRPAPEVPREPVIVFSGNLEYGPNRGAVRYFRERIWPRLRERRPELRWRLIGKNPQAVKAIVAGDPRIELTGPVQDALAALAAAQVAVVPVLAGSGTRIKILEAWAAGLPVVSTRLGAEGLEAVAGEHVLVADDADGFLEAIRQLLDSEALRARVGAAGRALYEREYTWEAAWQRLNVAGF